MIKNFAFMFFFFALIAIFAAPAAKAEALLQTSAKQAIVIDYDTGTVLLEKNADERMPTSSMSKVMTMFMVFDALKKGQISLDGTFIVSEKAWRMGGSKMFIEVDKAIKIEDLIRGVIVQSGNDATVVLAEGLAGTEAAFAASMTNRAKELGMASSNFVNASGWPDPEHYSTARDLAVLAKALIDSFPDYYKYYAETEFTYNGIKQGNRNPLLYRNIGADGIKTGHTEDAGYGLIGSGVHEGRRVIFVVNGLSSASERAEEAAKLLEFGLRQFENVSLFKAGESVTEIPVVLGEQAVVSVAANSDIAVTVPTISRTNFKVYADVLQPLKAPVQKGQEVGSLVIEVPDQPAVKLPLYASADIAEKGFFSKALSRMGLNF
jgi:D-alanyl-D-alanine carboxypeptidase (penicillin-binding protein 5/6)